MGKNNRGSSETRFAEVLTFFKGIVMTEIDIPTVTNDTEFLPVYATEHAAGADVKAYLKEQVVIEPGDSALIPTGLRFAIPTGHEVQVRPRSGLAFKNQITVLNTPGTIDAD